MGKRWTRRHLAITPVRDALIQTRVYYMLLLLAPDSMLFVIRVAYDLILKQNANQ